MWLAQRVSAAVLGLCVVVHLITMIYAVRGGLSAAEILSRTHGSFVWLTFYCVFVAAIAVHAPIGLRNVLSETLGCRGVGLDLAATAGGIALAWLGWRAALGVFF